MYWRTGWHMVIRSCGGWDRTILAMGHIWAPLLLVASTWFSESTSTGRIRISPSGPSNVGLTVQYRAAWINSQQLCKSIQHKLFPSGNEKDSHSYWTWPSRNDVSFPMRDGGESFHSYGNVYQRVPLLFEVVIRAKHMNHGLRQLLGWERLSTVGALGIWFDATATSRCNCEPDGWPHLCDSASTFIAATQLQSFQRLFLFCCLHSSHHLHHVGSSDAFGGSPRCVFQWVNLRANLQETIDFPWFLWDFPVIFPSNPPIDGMIIFEHNYD